MEFRSLALDPDPGNVRAARLFVHDLLADDLHSPVRDLAVLLTSELVTNAFMHAASRVEVRVATDDRKVDIEVSDWGIGEPQVVAARPLAQGGRGMALVDTLTDEWGVRHGTDTKTVWFSITVDPPQD